MEIALKENIYLQREQLARALKALVGRLRQEPIENALVAGKPRRQLRHRTVHVLIHETRRSLRLVQPPPGEHFIEDHAQAVEVRAAIRPLSQALLGAHVARRPRHAA